MSDDFKSAKSVEELKVRGSEREEETDAQGEALTSRREKAITGHIISRALTRICKTES